MKKLSVCFIVLAQLAVGIAEEMPFWGGQGESATNRQVVVTVASGTCATAFDSRTQVVVLSDRVHPPRGGVLIFR